MFNYSRMYKELLDIYIKFLVKIHDYLLDFYYNFLFATNLKDAYYIILLH